LIIWGASVLVVREFWVVLLFICIFVIAFNPCLLRYMFRDVIIVRF
jgi:hypothetical protein